MNLTKIADAIADALAHSSDPLAHAQQLRAAIVEGLGRAAKDGVTVRDRHVDSPIPRGGALLHDHPSVPDMFSVRWFPRLRDAQAALAALALHEGRTPEGDVLDYTSPGCEESRAWVEPRE